MINKKTVSIIVPSYKYGKYLKECIDSILNQTYPAHEIIVVDDGTPDINEVPSVLEFYKGRGYPIKLIRKTNGGLSSARNLGIQEATGELIQCLDADDKLVPGAIEEHVKLMTDDMTIAQCALMEFGDRHIIMIPTTPTGLERIMQSNTIFCNAMFSKRIWQEVGGFDESETMRWGWEDYEFWIRCLAYGCRVNTSDFIALRYRCHEGQMTQATTHPHKEELKKYIYEKHKDLYEKHNLTIK